jgi:hypothetical protein
MWAGCGPSGAQGGENPEPVAINDFVMWKIGFS